MLEQCVPEALDPVERTHTGADVKSCSLWEGLMLEQYMKNCIPWEGPQTGAGEQ